MKRLNNLKLEKETLVLEVEREEELLTNQLQSKLEQVRKEKVQLENELEHEQEYIVNKLQKQLGIVTAEKSKLEAKLRDESHGLFDTLDASLTRLKGMGEDERIKAMERMTQEIRSLRSQQEKFDKERTDFKVRNGSLREDLNKLRSQNNRLQQKIMAEHSKLKEITDAKTLLEQNREIDLERLYNLGSTLKLDQSGNNRRASSPILTFVRDRSRTSSTYTSDCEGDETFMHSGSPGNRSRASSRSSRASSRQKPRSPEMRERLGRTPSPNMQSEQQKIN